MTTKELDLAVDDSTVKVDASTRKLRANIAANSFYAGGASEDTPSQILLAERTIAGRTTGGNPAALTPAQIQQDVLGHGKVFTLSQFGWAGETDIGPFVQLAIAAQTGAKHTTLVLPAGSYTSSVPWEWTDSWWGESGDRYLCILGYGCHVKFDAIDRALVFDTGLVTKLFYGLQLYGLQMEGQVGSMPSLSIGLLVKNAIHPIIRDVKITSWHAADNTAIGYVIAAYDFDDTDPFTPQSVAGVTQQGLFSRVEAGSSDYACILGGVNASMFNRCDFEQNTQEAIRAYQAQCTFQSCTVQQSSASHVIHTLPVSSGDINIIISDLYHEGTLGSDKSVVKAEAPSARTVDGLAQNTLVVERPVLASALSGAGVAYVNVEDGHLVVEGPFGGASTWSAVKQRNMVSSVFRNIGFKGTYNGNPLDSDARSMLVTDWSERGRRMDPAAPQLSSYKTQARREDLLSALRGIYGARLISYFDMQETSDVNPTSTYGDQANGLLDAISDNYLTAAVANSRRLVIDTGNFNNRPVAQWVDNTGYVSGTGLGLLATGYSPYLFFVGRITDTGNDSYPASVGSGAGSYTLQIKADAAGTYTCKHGSDSGTGGTTDTSQHVFELGVKDGSNKHLVVDGTEAFSWAGMSTAGALNYAKFGPGDLIMAGAFLISDTPTADELTATRAALAKRYG